jgi:integrase
MRAGRDPSAERRARLHAATSAGKTVEKFADQWMVDHVLPKCKPKTADDYARLLKRHILPHLGNRPVVELTWKDVSDLHTKMKATPRAANMVVDLLRAMLGHAVRAKLRADNPAIDVTRYQERERERFLSPREFALATEAIDRALSEGVIDQRAAAGLKLVIHTGARRGEIQAAKWEHLDWSRRLIRLPDSKANVPRTIHLSAGALALLRTLPRTGPFIVGGYRGFLTSAWLAVRKRCGLDDCRLHDLRHSYASAALRAGVPLAMVGKLLGHKKSATTMRYAHLADDDAAAANETVGAALAGMTAPVGATVVKLHRRRGRR